MTLPVLSPRLRRTWSCSLGHSRTPGLATSLPLSDLLSPAWDTPCILLCLSDSSQLLQACRRSVLPSPPGRPPGALLCSDASRGLCFLRTGIVLPSMSATRPCANRHTFSFSTKVPHVGRRGAAPRGCTKACVSAPAKSGPLQRAREQRFLLEATTALKPEAGRGHRASEEARGHPGGATTGPLGGGLGLCTQS